MANDIRLLTTSAGDPTLFTGQLHDAGITVLHVAGTRAARKAVDADIIEGMWAGCREVLAATADRLGPREPSSDGS